MEAAGLPYALAVYEVADDGSLTLVDVSQRSGARSGGDPPSAAPPGQERPAASVAAQVVHRATAGRRYLVRVGALGTGPGGEFTLRWEETAAPVRFRFLGYLAGGDADPAGNYVDPDFLAGLSGLATDGGATLYAAASGGLAGFGRDAASGFLTLSRSVAKDWSGTPRALLHDPRSGHLHAYGCLAWDVFSTVGGRLADAGRDDVGAGLCGDGRAFMDSERSAVYVVERSVGLAVLGFDGDGGLRHEQTVDIPGATDALISDDDTRVYAATDRDLVVFERDRESGTLTRSGAAALPAGFADAFGVGLAISGAGARLFAYTDSFLGNAAAAFDLGADPSRPALLHSLSLDEHLDPQAASRCRLAGPRTGTPGVGLFCAGSILGLQWDAAVGELELTDIVRRVDRFNNVVPHFDTPRGLALSADGRHAYLATAGGGILFFERVGNFD